jgi:hypothetical protein
VVWTSFQQATAPVLPEPKFVEKRNLIRPARDWVTPRTYRIRPAAVQYARKEASGRVSAGYLRLSRDHRQLPDHITSSMTEREIIDTTERSDEEDSEPELENGEAIAEGSASGSKPKKKKKRSKAAKALAALKGKDKVPQQIVDEVLKRVREEHGADAPGADEATIREALDYLKINDVVKGKAGLGGKGRKDMGEHKVCLQLLFIIFTS